MKEIPIIIPYLADKFSKNNFQRMQINLFVWRNYLESKIDLKKKYTYNTQPKSIQISTESIRVDEITFMYSIFDCFKLSFNHISDVTIASKDIYEQLETLSGLAKKV